MTNTFTLKSGTNKGNRRIWIEGNRLLEAGWTKGTQLHRIMEVQGHPDSLMLIRAEGKHRISGNEGRPILDMSGKWVTEFMGDSEHFLVELTDERIIITPCDMNLEDQA